jgi:hypothetical protein
MPISAIDGMDEGHWADVLSIITEAVDVAGFNANLVSNSEDVGVIQKRIVQNLYENEIVVCDVSGKNPNVMFELGMRLAFDKPTIIIKDDKTSYSFDTSPIEHLNYPRDLRFAKIVDFKKRLAAKISSTLRSAKDSDSYSPFLKHFGDFKVAKIDTKEVSGQEFILEEIKALKQTIVSALKANRPQNPSRSRDELQDFIIIFSGLDRMKVAYLTNAMREHPDVDSAEANSIGDNEYRFAVSVIGLRPITRSTLLSFCYKYIVDNCGNILNPEA